MATENEDDIPTNFDDVEVDDDKEVETAAAAEDAGDAPKVFELIFAICFFCCYLLFCCVSAFCFTLLHRR